MKNPLHDKSAAVHTGGRSASTAVSGACLAHGLALGATLLLLTGCASSSTIPAHCYLQRTPIRVAVMPSVNTTDQPGASIIFDKACEEALRQKGFQVVSADQVVTYASSRGLSLPELAARKASETGKDLKVDMLFSTTITRWKTTYILVQGKSEVAGTSRLTEAATDALVWRLPWKLATQSGSGGGSGLGALVSAAVTAITDSAFDKCSHLGEQAAQYSVSTLPYPGFAPRKQ